MHGSTLWFHSKFLNAENGHVSMAAPGRTKRWLPAGHTVGNDKLVKLKRATKVAVIPIGYQNGFGAEGERTVGLWATLRRWWRSRNMTVLVRSQRVEVLGRVGAIETLVDVTNVHCAPGDTVIFEIDPLLAQGMKKEYR